MRILLIVCRQKEKVRISNPSTEFVQWRYSPVQVDSIIEWKNIDLLVNINTPIIYSIFAIPC